MAKTMAALALFETHGKLLAFCAGIAIHILVFRRGEWDLRIPMLVAFYGCLQLLSVVYLCFLSRDSYSFSHAVRIVAGFGFCFLVGLANSMLIYRAFFHRLNRFPGPFFARLSNLYAAGLTARNLQLYSEVEKLHEQYGDFVRLGKP